MRLLEAHNLTCNYIILIWACLQSYDKQLKQTICTQAIACRAWQSGVQLLFTLSQHIPYGTK